MQTISVELELRNFMIDNFLYGRSIDLQPGDSLLEKGIIDSTGVLELVAFLETQYAITVEDDEVTPGNLDSLESLVGFLARKRNGAV
jgi:acyl carrier protein